MARNESGTFPVSDALAVSPEERVERAELILRLGRAFAELKPIRRELSTASPYAWYCAYGGETYLHRGGWQELTTDGPWACPDGFALQPSQGQHFFLPALLSLLLSQGAEELPQSTYLTLLGLLDGSAHGSRPLVERMTPEQRRAVLAVVEFLERREGLALRVRWTEHGWIER